MYPAAVSTFYSNSLSHSLYLFTEILEPVVGPIVNILHNAVTLYKRTIGSRQICTPSVRYVIDIIWINEIF